MTTVMLIGLGDLGAVILELLVRESSVGRIVVASRSVTNGVPRVNLTRLGAMAQGLVPDIRFVALDLNDRDSVADTVTRERPQVIVHTATMQSWWVPDRLPPKAAATIRQAGFGVWLPVHLTLTMKLMEGLRTAGYPGTVLSAPYPDVVNCILGKLDLAPTSGFGNVDEIVPKVAWLAAEKLAVPPDTVRVYLVAHHALERSVFGDTGSQRPPFLVKVELEGRDVTREVDAHDLLFQPMPVSAGRVTHLLTAGSAVRLVRAVLGDEETLIHVPGPKGRPGGYPVWAANGGVRLALPDDWSEEQAVAINERSHAFDGIESIGADGTAVFTDDASANLRQSLGYDCERLLPADAEPRAEELITRFRQFAARHGVDFR